MITDLGILASFPTPPYVCVSVWVCAWDACRGQKCGIPLELVTVSCEPPDVGVQVLSKREYAFLTAEPSPQPLDSLFWPLL